MSRISPSDVMVAYKQACEIELQAFKPGNVSVYAEGHDMTVDDFRVSADVSAAAICHPDYSLGEKIYYAVKATRTAVGCNTNLGIVLLCAPLVQAVTAADAGTDLRLSLEQVLQQTTVADANWVFKAISLAAPGGLGKSEQQDVHTEAEMTLREAMQLAAHKDRIALQYVSSYKDVFELAILRYNLALNRFGISKWAALSVYTALLSHYPDSHIERKYGDQFNELVMQSMEELDRELSNTDDPENLVGLLFNLDQDFKSRGVNPGTTADLTVVTVFSVLLGRLLKQT